MSFLSEVSKRRTFAISLTRMRVKRPSLKKSIIIRKRFAKSWYGLKVVVQTNMPNLTGWKWKKD